MAEGRHGPDRTPADPATLPEPAVLARLVPFLTQSVMVVRRDWTVAADLAPPQGLLRRGTAVGSHPFSAMHPDDVERVSQFAEQAMRTEPGWTGSVELRAQRGDGSYGLFQIEVHNCFDDPVLDGMVAVSRELPGTDPLDVPSLSAEVAAELRLGVVGEHLPIGLLLLDRQGDVVFANHAACELLGTTRADLLGGRLPSAFSEVDGAEVMAILRRLRTTPGKETFTAALASDPPRLVCGTFVSRAGEGTAGEVLSLIVTVEDVTHRTAREHHLEQRANHDHLTGLPNRAWLLDHLHDRLVEGPGLVVAFVDLDGFKGVNDRLGHAAGDDLLADVADAIRTALEPGEVAARVGGDEFVVVAEAVGDRPGGGRPGGDLIDRIRAAVRGTAAASDQQIDVSVGVTESRPGDQPWDVLGRADAAMYGDKRRLGPSRG